MASSTPDTRADSVEDVSITNTSVNQSQDNPLEESEEVLGVSIHRCSPLQPHRLLQHPLVKIHIVDGESGLYVSSTSRKTSKAVSTRLNYVAPTATQACSLNKKKPIPVWEEMITIKELTTASLAPSTILFFEVVDFSPAKRDAPGWHYIAWAFLKVFSNQGAANIGPKCKLQLYTYTSWPHTSNVSLEGSTCHVWRMWSRHHREKYSGSLTVSLHSLVVDDEEEVTQDRTWLDLTEENADLYQQGGLEEQDYPKKGKNQVVPWSRLPGELCTVPTRQSVAMQGGSKGGTALAFSKDGRKLAVAMADEGAYPIGIFSIPDGEKLGVLAGHVN